MRRTRILLELPSAEDQTVILSLSTQERTVYSRIIEDAKRRIDDCISSRSVAKAYNGIFQAILRLRLLCNNGTQQICDSRSGVQGGRAEIEYLEGGKLACLFCSCEIFVSDGQDDISPSASPRNSPQLLCPTCLSPNDIDMPRYQERPRKQGPTNSRHVQQINDPGNSSPRRDNEDHTPSISLRPSLIPKGQSSKLSALVRNIQENMLGNKRYADPTQKLNMEQH